MKANALAWIGCLREQNKVCVFVNSKSLHQAKIKSSFDIYVESELT